MGKLTLYNDRKRKTKLQQDYRYSDQRMSILESNILESKLRSEGKAPYTWTQPIPKLYPCLRCGQERKGGAMTLVRTPEGMKHLCRKCPNP